jgi:hypothetical protein
LENIAEILLARIYYDAFQRKVCEGDDSLKVEGLNSLVANPASHRFFGTPMRSRQPLARVFNTLGEAEFETWLWREGR